VSALDAVDSYAWDDSADELEKVVRKYAPQLLQLSYEAANLPGIDFDLTNPRVQDTIDDLAKKVRNVPETTRDSIRGWVKAGTEDGWSVDKIAKRIREDGQEISKSRATTISRTESAAAYNGGAILAYRDAGVEKVRVLDGDDDEECAKADGEIWTLEEAEANPTAHPNCTRSFAAVIE
jgi:SPP1 gp7 family putative phage head morphogenesis protein